LSGARERRREGEKERRREGEKERRREGEKERRREREKERRREGEKERRREGEKERRREREKERRREGEKERRRKGEKEKAREGEKGHWPDRPVVRMDPLKGVVLVCPDQDLDGSYGIRWLQHPGRICPRPLCPHNSVPRTTSEDASLLEPCFGFQRTPPPMRSTAHSGSGDVSGTATR